MGVRKREKAIEIKEAKRNVAFAKLNNCPTSPRKMRLVADLVRGIPVERALAVLKFNQKDAAASLHKLLLSAIDNWKTKNEGADIETAQVFVKEIPCRRRRDASKDFAQLHKEEHTEFANVPTT